MNPVAASMLDGTIEAGGATARIRIEAQHANRFDAQFDDGPSLCIELMHVEHLPDDVMHLSVVVDGTSHSLLVTRKSPFQWTVDHDGIHRTVALGGSSKPRSLLNKMKSDTVSNTLLAPMPSRIAEILTAPDSLVEEGQALLRIEAMKMVMTLSAPARTRIRSIHVASDESVPAGHLLITFHDID